jgi:hypothetical protein
MYIILYFGKYFIISALNIRGWDSLVGISTCCGLCDPGSNTGGNEIFRTCPDRAWGAPNLLCNGNWVFYPRVKRPGSVVNHPPNLALRLKKK